MLGVYVVDVRDMVPRFAAPSLQKIPWVLVYAET